VIVGAGASAARRQTVSEYAPEEKQALVGLIAGGPAAALQEMETAANDYDLGALELQSVRFSNDMLLALTVSGKTPWVWGAMRHAWSLGALSLSSLSRRPARRRSWRISLLPANRAGSGGGVANPKAQMAQRQIVTC
jgi:N-acetylmuramic acid 6-phosphate etherase